MSKKDAMARQDAIVLLYELYNFYSKKTDEERAKVREHLLEYLRRGISNEEELSAFVNVFKCVMGARRSLRELIGKLINLLKETLGDTFGIEVLQLDPALDAQVMEYYDGRKYWEVIDAIKKGLQAGNLDAETTEVLDVFLRALDECRAYERKVHEVLDVVSGAYYDAVSSEDGGAAAYYYDLEGDLVNNYIFECKTIMEMYLYRKYGG
jgi:hypothetical protein